METITRSASRLAASNDLPGKTGIQGGRYVVEGEESQAQAIYFPVEPLHPGSNAGEAHRSKHLTGLLHTSHPTIKVVVIGDGKQVQTPSGKERGLPGRCAK